MDYGKAGSVLMAKKAPKHDDRKAQAKDTNPGGRSSKAELLARMKAAAEAKKPG